MDRDPSYHSEDYLAPEILPGFLRTLMRMHLLGSYLIRRFSPRGVYEYIVARTKYLDDAFRRALADGFSQVLLFGAGYDTRGLRFEGLAHGARIFELDSPHTQRAKIEQLGRRGLIVPSNIVFVPIDFDVENLSRKLATVGFRKDSRTLFVLEGVLMYLLEESVVSTFGTIEEYAGDGSRVVFDYLRASVLDGEGSLYGEAELKKTVSRAGEEWRFGFEPDEVGSFAEARGFQVVDHKCAEELETAYFGDTRGRRIGRVNGTHCIVTLERRSCPPSGQ
jgi:methyltransferase (TIGR00027 family)